MPPSAPSTRDFPALCWGLGTSLQPPPPPSRRQGNRTQNDSGAVKSKKESLIPASSINKYFLILLYNSCVPRRTTRALRTAECFLLVFHSSLWKSLFLAAFTPLVQCTAPFLCKCTGPKMSKPRRSLLICWNMSNYFSITPRWERDAPTSSELRLPEALLDKTRNSQGGNFNESNHTAL